jgi:protein-disulfide isomerase
MRNRHQRVFARVCRLATVFSFALAFSPGASDVCAQTTDPVVAVINGRPITQSEVDDTISQQLQPLQQQIYALRKRALENLITTAVLETEAKRRRVALDELKRQLTAGKVEVSTSQVEQTYLENASSFGAMSPDEVKERIRLDLESHARMRNYREAVEKLRSAAAIEMRFEDSLKVSVRDLESAPSTGEKDAAVTIVEFTDYQCSFCKSAEATVKQTLQTFPSKVRLIIKQMPITDAHPQALDAARAAFCAGEQGAFWKYHDALFATESLLPESLNSIAAQVGINIAQFRNCTVSEASRAAVIKDIVEAKRLGITGTPTFVVNGKLVRGAISFDEFRQIIERELKTAKVIPPPP